MVFSDEGVMITGAEAEAEAEEKAEEKAKVESVTQRKIEIE